MRAHSRKQKDPSKNLPDAAGPRGSTHLPLVCCLCGDKFASHDLIPHFDYCRKDKVTSWSLLPEPYNDRASEGFLNPRTLMARNM